MDRVSEVHPDPPRHGVDGSRLQKCDSETLEVSHDSQDHRAFGAIRRVQLDAIPDLSDPQVIIFTEYKGQSPTLIEDQVTYPIASSLLAAPKVAAVRGYS